MSAKYPEHNAISDAYEEISNLKGLRNRYDIEDEDIIYHNLSQENYWKI